MFVLRNLIILTLAGMIFVGCGQQTLKDEGLDSKSIDEAGTSSSGTTFSVSSNSPADEATGVSRNPTINITFSDNVHFDQSGSNMTGWTRSYNTSAPCSGSTYNNYSIHLSEDSFSNCISDNGSVSGKTVTLRFNRTLTGNAEYKVRVYKTSLDGLRKTQSSSGNELTENYTFSFTTGS